MDSNTIWRVSKSTIGLLPSQKLVQMMKFSLTFVYLHLTKFLANLGFLTIINMLFINAKIGNASAFNPKKLERFGWLSVYPNENSSLKLSVTQGMTSTSWNNGSCLFFYFPYFSCLQYYHNNTFSSNFVSTGLANCRGEDSRRWRITSSL